jgi:hypothetical protein
VATDGSAAIDDHPDRPDGSMSGSGTWCAEVELSGTPRVGAVLPRSGQRRARVLVRLHGEPLGYLTVPLGRDGLDVAALAATARSRFADLVGAHLAAEGLGAVDGSGETPARTPACPNHVTSEVPVTVVVCTRDRSTELVACLRHLQALTYPLLEIVVVDNAPTDDSTEQVVSAVARQDARFRYVREPRPGLSAARNRGLREAGGTCVAYTDDDVAVDPEWVQGIVRGFQRRPDIGCVTGLVATAAISSAAEEYFDARAASTRTHRASSARAPTSPSTERCSSASAASTRPSEPVHGPAAARTSTSSCGCCAPVAPSPTSRPPWSGTTTGRTTPRSSGRCTATAPA